jgi:hypothetical protein
MGSITPYDTANGRRDRVRYRKPDSTQTDKRGFRTKRAAEMFLSSVTISKTPGDYIDPALSRITTGQLSTLWVSTKRPPVVKPSSYLPLLKSRKAQVEPRWSSRVVLRTTLRSAVVGVSARQPEFDLAR